MTTRRKRVRTEKLVPDRTSQEVQQPEHEVQPDTDAEIELEPEPTPSGNIGKKPVRGKTTLQIIPTGETKKQEVEWNEKGQPVGHLSVRFSSTIGCLVREQVPINIDSWHKVNPTDKDEVWKLLMTKFLVELTHKTVVLQQCGRLWRAYKSDLSTSITKIVESRCSKAETTRQLAMLRPTDVPQQEWNEFVAKRCTEAWKEKSDKMKTVRAKQLLPHTLSRQGYARMQYEYELKNPGQSLSRTESFIKGHEPKKTKNEYVATKVAEIQAKLNEQPPNKGPVHVKLDVLSQILGKEKPGRVRGMGAGVTPSRVDAQIQNTSWKKKLEDKLEASNERMTALEDIIFKLSQGGIAGCNCRASFSDGGSKSKHPRPPATAPRVEPETNEGRVTPITMATANSKSVQASTLCVNDRCNLLDWEGTDEVVATGKISVVDPATKVHGYKLGPDCYRVEVVEAINPRAEFYRNQPEFSAMENAVGSTIAWPIKYIVPHH